MKILHVKDMLDSIKIVLLLMFQQNDVMKYFREDLHRRLLSTDFKKQVDGIEMMQKVLLM